MKKLKEDFTGELQTVPIERLAKGHYFRKVGQKQVLIADGYNRFARKYGYTKASDISADGTIKKGTLVEINFDY